MKELLNFLNARCAWLDRQPTGNGTVEIFISGVRFTTTIESIFQIRDDIARHITEKSPEAAAAPWAINESEIRNNVHAVFGSGKPDGYPRIPKEIEQDKLISDVAQYVIADIQLQLNRSAAIKLEMPPRHKAGDKQVGGTHYQLGTDPWALIKAMQSSGDAFLDYCRGNIIKYPFRVKGGKPQLLEDLKKAQHYCEAAIERLELTLWKSTEQASDGMTSQFATALDGQQQK